MCSRIFCLMLLTVGCQQTSTPVFQPVGRSLGYRGPSAQHPTGQFTVVGLSAELIQRLEDPAARSALFVSVDGQTPILGESGITSGVLWFTPRFPLAYGVPCKARFDPAKLVGTGDALTITITPTAPDTPPTNLVRVSPTGAVVPENVLRFYLEFSAPMSRGEVYQRVQLLNAKQEPVELPFLELETELWDPTGTRLTLLIDPGRIKRGVTPREEIGTVFFEGERFTLVVDPAWPDAHGKPLKTATPKVYTIGPPAAKRIEPSQWSINATRKQIVVRFPSGLDRGLLQHALTIAAPDAKPVEGSVAITEGETCWTFTPTDPLAPGDYTISIAPELEDPAGNRLDRAFDTEGDARTISQPIVSQRILTIQKN